jgi:hypothetical protein
VRPEIARVLSEIGVSDVVSLDEVAPEAAVEITVGSEPASDIVARLFDGPAQTEFGPTDLERLALARISRDRVERWLELR